MICERSKKARLILRKEINFPTILKKCIRGTAYALLYVFISQINQELTLKYINIYFIFLSSKSHCKLDHWPQKIALLYLSEEQELQSLTFQET